MMHPIEAMAMALNNAYRAGMQADAPCDDCGTKPAIRENFCPICKGQFCNDCYGTKRGICIRCWRDYRGDAWPKSGPPGG